MQKNKGYTEIKNGIDALPYSLSGQTFTNLGMDYALSFFTDPNYNPSAEVRDKVVIVFSDGQPTSRLYADWAIEAAYDLKNDEKVEVYTIGTFAGADPSVISGAATAAVDETWPVASDHEDDDDDEDADVANRFMNYLSSNAKKAKDLGVKFFKKEGQHYCKIKNEYTWKNKGYYLTANDAESLDQIFDDVSHGITVDAPSLGAAGQLKDFLSPYFAFPDGFTSSAITLQTVACTGVDANGAYQWAAPSILPEGGGVTAQYHPETQSITVTGFDYAANVVTETAKNEAGTDFGQKLMVSFSVKAKDGFLGGNDVVSNKDTSGIYTEQDEPLKKFDVPDTDVVLSTVPITTIDHSTYLGNAINSGNAVMLDQSPFDGINNAYVNTEVAIYWDENANGSIDDSERANFELVQIPAGYATDVLPFHNNLAPQANAQYLVEETITPIYGGTQQPWAGVVNDFWIYLLVPSVAVQDVWVDYGVQVGDYYYYKMPVQPNNTITVFERAQVQTQFATGQIPTLIITAQGIQTNAAERVWGVRIVDGAITGGG